MNATLPNWRPTRILAASDLSPCSDRALEYAVAIARQFDAYLYLTHVVPVPEHSLSPDEESPTDVARRKDAEQKMAMTLASKGIGNIKHEILIERGFLWQTLDASLRSHKIDLVVVGTHGHKEITGGFAGSWAELIFRHADCPVLTVGPGVKEEMAVTGIFKNIVLATDFGRAARRAVPYACVLARKYGAKLTLLHVLTDGGKYSPEGLATLRETTKVQLLESLPPEPQPSCTYDFAVLNGDPASEILNFARSNKNDLIVMGAKSRNAFLTHVPQPDTYLVASGAPCPLMTVKD